MFASKVRPLTFVRFASARASKDVKVQILRDCLPHGVRGQVVEVNEGLMRNKLHPQKFATYVTQGKPLQIPEVSAEEAAQKRAQAAPQSEETVEESKEETESKPSIFDMLKFPGEEAPATGVPHEPEEANSEAARAAGAASAEGAATENMPLGNSSSADAVKEDNKKFEWQNDIVAEMGKPGTK